MYRLGDSFGQGSYFLVYEPWHKELEFHPAGDVTRVSIVPRKVTVKIGDAWNWWLGCRDKNRFKKAKFLFV